MGTKNNPSKFDCYKNAEPDEPMFILLGRDPSAAIMVERWASHRNNDISLGRRPKSDYAIVTEALGCAAQMREFAQAWAARKRAERR